MSILDDMRSALRDADRSKRIGWQLSLGALHAVHADAINEKNCSAICDGSILGYPFSVTSEIEGWEMVQWPATYQSVG